MWRERRDEQLQLRFGEAARMLSDASDGLLALHLLPKEHWRQICSNNRKTG